MTKPKDLNSLSGVVGRAIELVGAQAVADALGEKSTSWVYKLADGDNDEVQLKNIKDALAIDRVCLSKDKGAPYLAFHARQLGVSGGAERRIEDDVLLLTESTGQVAKKLRQARSSNSPKGRRISPCEARDLHNEVQEVREACDKTDAAINVASDPRPHAVAAE